MIDLHSSPIPESKPAFTKSHTEEMLEKILAIMTTFTKERKEDAENESCINEWMLVALVMDRFLLALFICLTLIMTMSVLLQAPSNDYEDAVNVV